MALAGETSCPQRDRPYLLTATILASAMAFIDATVVTIALPSLQADLNAPFQAVQWVVNAYALTLGALILVGGGAGDRFGRRRVFVVGTVLFALASLACALAPNIETLVAARAAQGVGAALLVPQSLAIIAAAYPKAERGRAIGLWAGASAITTSLGPTLGGFLIDALDWRAIFWLNLPLAAAVLYLAQRHIPETRDEAISGPLDWPGGLLAVVGFGALTLGLTMLTATTAFPILVAATLVAGVVGLALFIVNERRAAAPLVPLSLFSNRVFTSVNIMTVFLYGALTGVLFLAPFDLIERRGLSATEVGLTFLPVGLIIGVLSRVAGDWADREGPRSLLILGSLLVTAGTAGLASGLANYWLGVALPVVLIALGMALVVAPLTTAVMVSAPDDQSGAASGVNNAASRIAGLFAIAIVGGVASAVYANALSGAGLSSDAQQFGVFPSTGVANRATIEDAFVTAYQAGLWVAAALALLSAVMAFVFLRARAPASDA